MFQCQICQIKLRINGIQHLHNYQKHNQHAFDFDVFFSVVAQIKPFIAKIFGL